MAEAWAKLTWAQDAQLKPWRGAYEAGLADALRDIGCDASGAPYVIQGLLRTIKSRFEEGSPYPSQLADAFLDEAKCPGAVGLSEDDKAKLREISGPGEPAPDGQPTSSQQ